MKQSSPPTLLPANPQTTVLKDVQTAYWEAGRSGAQPLVLLHGLAGSHHGLMLLAEHLTDYHLFLPDLPGHGGSAVPAHADAEALGAWFAAFLELVRERTGQVPLVVAHSFGSQIAAIACQQAPQSFARCVLMNPVPHVSVMPRLFQHSLAFVPHTVAHRLGANQHTQYWRNFYLLVRRDPQSIARMQWVISHGVNKPGNFAFYINLSRQLMNLATYSPTLGKSGTFYCIVGDTDRMINSKTLAYLRSIFGTRHFAVCARTGHLMPIEAPQETAALVRAALLA